MKLLNTIFHVGVLSLALIAANPASGLVSPLHTRQYTAVRSTRLQSTAPVNNDAEILNDPMFIQPHNDKSSEELITIAKRFLFTSKGLGGDPNMLAPSFQFEGPVVGPLSKDDFVAAIGSVDFDTAFPNWTPQFYGFFVDPLEVEDEGGSNRNYRVWYTAKGYGRNDGPLLPFAPEATGKIVENPPQMCSLTIDKDSGLITRYTIGYVTDRSVGNTGGLGGLYGILYALGKPLPFPEAQPWKMSWQYGFFQKIGSLINN